MATQLPDKLKKEPLIDAIFEVRFAGNASGADVIPGFLFGKLDGEKSIERLPAAELPRPVRDNDANLRFAPLVRLNWRQFTIAIGDRVLAVGCKLPYPGWSEFKPAILDIVGLVKSLGIIQSVQRYSMKYVDLIPADSIVEQIARTCISISLGDHHVTKEHFSLRLEIPESEMVHIINIITSAIAELPDGSKKEGVIVDIDTIKNANGVAFDTWLSELSNGLDVMHLANKQKFFDSLAPQTIDDLEPIYG